MEKMTASYWNPLLETLPREKLEKIEEIERLALQLKEMGKGMPVVEKNARSILSFTHVLRCGISDPVEVYDI